MPKFIITSNITEKERVKRGNSKVINARFNDGLFFYQQDTRQGIDKIATKSNGVIHHQKLGYFSDKISRIRAIALLLNEQSQFVDSKILPLAVEFG